MAKRKKPERDKENEARQEQPTPIRSFASLTTKQLLELPVKSTVYVVDSDTHSLKVETAILTRVTVKTVRTNEGGNATVTEHATVELFLEDSELPRTVSQNDFSDLFLTIEDAMLWFQCRVRAKWVSV